MLRTPNSPALGLAARWLPAALLATCLLGGLQLEAQDPAQKPADGKKEEYDPSSAKPRKPIRVDDEDPAPAKTDKPVDADSGDLLRAAREAKSGVVSSLFRDLAEPHDDITFRGGAAIVGRQGRVEHVAPLPTPYTENRPEFKGRLSVKPIDQEGKGLAPYEITAASIESIEPYEQLALTRVDAFLKGGNERLDSADRKYVPREQMLDAAALVLSSVLRFHDSARARDIRRGEEWDRFRERVHQRLFDVHLERLDFAAKGGSWDQTLGLATEFVKDHGTAREKAKLVLPLIRLAEQNLGEGASDEKLREGHKRLQLIEQLFPSSAANSSLGDDLRKKAEGYLAQARTFGGNGKTPEALKLLDQAEALWPNLPGLHDEKLRLSNTYPVLRVGTRDLPTDLVPGLACTDTEKRASELIFESLMRPAYDPAIGWTYVPQLAVGRPTLVPLGRQFQISPDASWSDGKPVEYDDLSASYRLRKNKNWPGYSPVFADQLEEALPGSRPGQVVLTMGRGHIDPLSLMGFKILPASMIDKGDPDVLSANPVGSGPFMRKKAPDPADREAVFVANPYYGNRVRASGKQRPIRLPRIREVRFVKSDDPVKDLVDHKVDLVVDPPNGRIKDLRGYPGLAVEGPLPNRRIYFLAVNHHRPSLANSDLRRAIAAAIDREKLLDDCYRSAPKAKEHAILTGPYPPASWASDPNLPTLFNPDQASVFRDLASKAGLTKVELTIKYDQADDRADKAMRRLCEEVNKLIGVNLTPEPMEAHALRDDLEKKQTYDLAYYHFDYASESFWLWPLLDLNGNYFNWQDDGRFALVPLFDQALNERNFADLQRLTRQIHGVFSKQVPFVPLWQLDSYIAHDRNLKAVFSDPLLVFPGAEQWALEKQ